MIISLHLVYKFITAVFLACNDQTEALAPLAVTRGVSASRSFTSLAAKKRRRRKEPSSQAEASTFGSPSTSDKNSMESSTIELPDFDLEEDPKGLKTGETSGKAASTRASNPTPTNLEVVTPAMMGSVGSPARSVKELLSDRSLEKSLDFEEIVSDENLPDLIEMMKGKQKTAPDEIVGKKKARQAERRAAALAREKENGPQNFGPLDFLSGIPFLVDKETGKVTYLKLVEAGTWMSIFILIGWEVYINSPFFERAAPISPVVF